MTVSDATPTTSTSSPSSPDETQDVGLTPELLTQTDFIGVRAALVSLLGNDANRALVLTRIFYRADPRWREAHEADGFWWWRASRETIAQETGLTANQVQRILKWLDDNGFIESVAFQMGGRWDQTRSLRVVLHRAICHDDPAESQNEHSAESQNAPIQTEEEVKRKRERETELSPDWEPTPEHADLASRRGLDLEEQVTLFRLHAETHARRAKRWNAAFTMWLTKARPPSFRVNPQRPGPRSDSQRMLDIMQLDTSDTTLEQELFRQMNGDKT